MRKLYLFWHKQLWTQASNITDLQVENDSFNMALADLLIQRSGYTDWAIDLKCTAELAARITC